ncbi:MAG: hypothetical protein ABIB98_00920 [bacterium]
MTSIVVVSSVNGSPHAKSVATLLKSTGKEITFIATDIATKIAPVSTYVDWVDMWIFYGITPLIPFTLVVKRMKDASILVLVEGKSSRFKELWPQSNVYAESWRTCCGKELLRKVQRLVYVRRFRELFRGPLEEFWEEEGFNLNNFTYALFPTRSARDRAAPLTLVREKYGSEGVSVICGLCEKIEG